MKKMKFLFVFLAVSIFLSLNVYAVETYERTPDNYRVPSDITVDSSNFDNVMSTPSVNKDDKVYDFADLFTEKEEKKLYNDIKDYKKSNNYELIIVTIDDNADKSYQDYAKDFYDYNYFELDGILLLIDMDSRKYYMSTSGKAIDSYSDSECYNVEDELYDYMVDGDYYEAADNFITLANKYVSNYNNSDQYKYKDPIGPRIMKTIGCALICTIIGILVMVFKNRMVRKATSSRNFLNNETKSIISISDIFLGSTTTKTRIDTSSSSSGGSGSSRSRGSSGRSHGGGRGRGF